VVLRIPSGPEGSSGSNILCVLWDYPVNCLQYFRFLVRNQKLDQLAGISNGISSIGAQVASPKI
jgi:hypothetical protein